MQRPAEVALREDVAETAGELIDVLPSAVAPGDEVDDRLALEGVRAQMPRDGRDARGRSVRADTR